MKIPAFLSNPSLVIGGLIVSAIVLLAIFAPFVSHYDSPSFFLYCLSTSAGAILDAEVVSAHEVSGDFGSSWLKTGQAVGTGPFTLSVWNPNQQIVLGRNDNYWADEPTLRSIIFLHAQREPHSDLCWRRATSTWRRN